MTNTSLLPNFVDANAIRVRSSDHTGQESIASSWVSRISRPPSARIEWICSRPARSLANTIESSGDVDRWRRATEPVGAALGERVGRETGAGALQAAATTSATA